MAWRGVPACCQLLVAVLPGAASAGIDVSVSSGSGGRMAQLRGLALAPAELAGGRDDGYAVSWKRMAAGEADPK